jgi:hypothetical protein
MKPPKPKTDNRSLRNKIALRRWLLGEMGITEVRVLDACAGAGHIWGAMKEHVTVRLWVRSDVQPRQVGTLKLSALQVMGALDLDQFNVIDIDPYGEPWDAYLALLPKLRQRTAVFLTRGRVTYSVASNVVLAACGIPPSWKVPHSVRLASYLDSMVLTETWRHAQILHASAVELRNVTYYALGLQPLTPPA